MLGKPNMVVIVSAIILSVTAFQLDDGSVSSIEPEYLTAPGTSPDSYIKPEVFKKVDAHSTFAGSIPAIYSESQEEASGWRPALVTGLVVSEHGAQSAHDRIEIYSPSKHTGYVTRSDTNGFFQFDNVLPAGDYQLKVTPKGMFKRYHEKPLGISPPLSHLYIILEELPVKTLRGIVVNRSEVPVPQFRFTVRSEEKRKWGREVITDSAGRFILGDVPVGKLFLTSMLGRVMSSRGHEFLGNSRALLKLVVDSGHHDISGLVIDQYYEAVVGANIMLSWEDTNKSARTTEYRRTITDMDGEFFIKGVGSGEHDLVIAGSNGDTTRKAIMVGDDTSDLTFVLVETQATSK